MELDIEKLQKIIYNVLTQYTVQNGREEYNPISFEVGEKLSNKIIVEYLKKV